MQPSALRKTVEGKPPKLYLSLISGFLSMYTFIGTKSLLIISAISLSEYDVSSMTWHQWHQTAVKSSKMGLSSFFAFSKDSLPHSSHLILSVSLFIVNNKNKLITFS